MNIRELWNEFRIGKMTEQELGDVVDGGKHEHYWLTTVEPPFWFVSEAMGLLNDDGR